MIASPAITLPGFSRGFTKREQPAIAIFGPESTGKTALSVNAGLWAREHGTTPGWLITERKTKKTVEDRCSELDLEIPLISDPFILPEEASQIIRLDRWIHTKEDGKDVLNSDPKIMEIYSKITERFFNAAAVLAKEDSINPIIIDSGTNIYNWISYSHNGRKQGVGMRTKWGPPQSDWEDLLTGLQHKLTLITFRSQDEWVGKETTGRLIPDGPRTLGYTVTSQVRLAFDKHRGLRPPNPDKNDPGESFIDRFSLDVWESQDNKGVAGVNGILKGQQITFANLLSLLRPELV